MNTLQVLDRPIAYHRSLVNVTGTVTGAVLLSQAIYWQNRCSNRDGWWYKTQEDWEIETGLSRHELESAKKSCSKVMSTKLCGLPRRTWYKVNVDSLIMEMSDSGAKIRLDPEQQEVAETDTTAPTIRTPKASLLENSKPVCRKPANCIAGNRQTTISTETSSESTTERESTHSPAGAREGRFQEPDQEEFKAYCEQRGIPEAEAAKCFGYYSAQHWIGKNGLIMDWKWVVVNWMNRAREKEQLNRDKEQFKQQAQSKIF